jgi:hypothetical protein
MQERRQALIFQHSILLKQQQSRSRAQAARCVHHPVAGTPACRQADTDADSATRRHLTDGTRGDFMLAYHLMDFSRYFFDQGNIRCAFFL